MENQISFQKFSKILKFAMKVINPYEETGEGVVKLTRLYRFFIATHLSMILVCFAFCVLEDAGVAAKTEAIAIILVYVRSMFYLLMMVARNSKWQATLGKIIDERKSVCPLDEKRFDLTVKYCKVEVMLLILGFVILWVLVALASIFAPLLTLNDLRLPLNFYIPGLHFEGLGWKWFLSYAFQVVNLCSIAVSFSFCVPLTPLLMNQVCLKVDEGALLVEKLGKSLVETKAPTLGAIKNVFVVDHKATAPSAIERVVDETKATTSGAIRKVAVEDKKAMRNAEIKVLTQRIAEMINSVNEWREESQDLMQLCFLVEFLILSFCFALGLFTITVSVAGSITVLLGLLVNLSQLLLYCWSGTSLENHVEKLAASLYDIEWHEMNVQQQKDILMMLTMTQNIEGFEGVFKPVSCETFKEILHFSYSMFSFLKAIN